VALAGALAAEWTSRNRLPTVNVTLAAAERRHVDGHAERLAPRVGCALRGVDHPTVVAVGIELEHPVIARRDPDLVEPWPRHAADEQQAAERLCRARERQSSVGMQLGETRERREQDRHALLRADERGREVRAAHVAKHSGPKGDAVERVTIAEQ